MPEDRVKWRPAGWGHCPGRAVAGEEGAPCSAPGGCRSCVQTARCTASRLYSWQLRGAGRAGQGPQSQTWTEAGAKTSQTAKRQAALSSQSARAGLHTQNVLPGLPQIRPRRLPTPPRCKVRQAPRAGARKRRRSTLAGAGSVSGRGNTDRSARGECAMGTRPPCKGRCDHLGYFLPPHYRACLDAGPVTCRRR